MKRLIITYLVFFWIAGATMPQVTVSGCITDCRNDEPLPGVSVIVKDRSGKMLKYAISKADGTFSLGLPSTEGCRLEAALMSYVRKSVALDSVESPFILCLEPGAVELKEVAVKADRIREQGDTVTYLVGSFAQQQDRSIGDVLARMPGISVEKSGKIQYQGEDINKFYIEGSDLLGGKYGIATNGIRHEDVGAVEVMENHQPMQVLSGISFSDKAAINLKLKNQAKATWTFHGYAGGGYSDCPAGVIYEGEFFAMAVMPGFQNITTLRGDNTGLDLRKQVMDFLAERRSTALSRYTGVSLPSVSGLNARRTLFNRSLILSTNSLRKLRRAELKAQADYSFSRVTADASAITTYFLPQGDRVVTEQRSGTDHAHSLSARLIYELNEKTVYVNNTLQTNLDWDDATLAVKGSIVNSQHASLPDYYVANRLKVVKRFGRKHLVTFISNNEWESLPQTLAVSLTESSLRQHIADHAFHTSESAAYTFVIRGITVGLEGGFRGYLRSMKSDLTGLPDAMPEMTNAVNTNCFTLFATPRFEYRLKRMTFNLDAPVSVSAYSFHNAIADRRELYFSPSLSLNWIPDNRFKTRLRASSGRSPMSLDLIQPGVILTDYRTLRRGVDDFHASSSQSVSANFSYRHSRRGIFANLMALQSWSRRPYTLEQQLIGDYVVNFYSTVRSSGAAFMANGTVGKTIDPIRGSASLTVTATRNESHLVSESREVRSVSTSRMISASVNGSVVRWLGIEARAVYSTSRLSMNGSGAPWLGNLESNLLLNIIPHRKWEWHISGEHYSNELAAGSRSSLLLLDTKLIFKPSRRVELRASVTNICDRRLYSYTVYNQLTSYESLRRLRGREFIITLHLKK